jgi:hypothetical protein
VSQFVKACRREWSRLGVPDAAANEMAADLEADLAEAHADGASPEVVLGNGYFDAKSFAASWALARGVVNVRPRVAPTVQLSTRTLTLVASALVCAAVAAVGLLLLAGRAVGSVSASAVSVRRPFPRQVPAIFMSPHRFFSGPGIGVDLAGWVLLIVGVLGFALTVWFWKPWSTARRPEPDHNVGLPTFL